MNALFIVLSGLFGVCARYAVLLWLSACVYPIATLVVNATGCLAAGVIVGLVGPGYITVQTRNWLIIGFCGAYTTMSAFALETVVLWQSGRHLGAAGNVLANIALCLLAVLVGKYIASCV